MKHSPWSTDLSQTWIIWRYFFCHYWWFYNLFAIFQLLNLVKISTRMIIINNNMKCCPENVGTTSQLLYNTLCNSTQLALFTVPILYPKKYKPSMKHQLGSGSINSHVLLYPFFIVQMICCIGLDRICKFKLQTQYVSQLMWGRINEVLLYSLVMFNMEMVCGHAIH